MSFLFSGYSYFKLALKTDINTERGNLLVVVDSASLGEQEPENETNNFGRSSLGYTVKNRMMKCDRKEEITFKFYKNEYTLCLKFLMSSWSVDPILGFKHL